MEGAREEIRKGENGGGEKRGKERGREWRNGGEGEGRRSGWEAGEKEEGFSILQRVIWKNEKSTHAQCV